MTGAVAQRRTHVDGAVLFARFAYPPNALGYCGPPDAQALLEQTAAASTPGLRVLARAFEGAWPYLELIAGASHLDPLDPRVVEAYWIGNPLLERVGASALCRSLEDRFRRRTGRDVERLLAAAPAGALPHHSFHVLGVYPWVGLLRSGDVANPLHVLEKCRIRWGRVQAVAGDQVQVRSRPLMWDGHRLSLGVPHDEWAVGAADGLALTPSVSVGDWCALHWDWVCDVLSLRRLAALQHYTARQLAVVNGLSHPRPSRPLAQSGWA